MLDSNFIQTLTEFAMLKKREKILLGISGGPDSICLLHQFVEIRQDYKLELVCLHFNHCLRDEAKQEEEFVKSVCEKLKVKCISESKKVLDFFAGDSLEQTARFLRFDFFLKCARQERAKKIALAHHKDDLIETVLMRLIRGTGLRGLRGFLPKTKYKSLTVLRPFINLRKEEILAWLKEKNIPYCLDQSNYEDKFLRNKIRLQVLPLLESLNPNLVDNVYQLAETVAYDYEFIDLIAKEALTRLKKIETRHKLSLDLEGLKKLPLALFNNLLRLGIEEVKGDMRKIDNRHLKEIYHLVLTRPNGSIVDLPGFLVKKEDRLLTIQILDFNV